MSFESEEEKKGFILENALKFKKWDRIKFRKFLREDSYEHKHYIMKELIQVSHELCEHTIDCLLNLSSKGFNDIKEECCKLWGQASCKIIKYMSINHRLFWEPKRFRYEKGGTEATVRIIDLIYMVYLKTLLCAGGCRMFDNEEGEEGEKREDNIINYSSLSIKKNNLHNLRASDIEYVRNDVLVVTSRPISSYNTKFILDAIEQLDTRWLLLRYSRELVKYLQLLEYRLAEILCFPDDQSVHCFPKYRDKIESQPGVDNEMLFVGNWKLLEYISVRTINMHRSLFVYKCIPVSPVQEIEDMFSEKYGIDYSGMKEITSRVKNYIEYTASRTGEETLESTLATNYKVLSCRPSEVERFKLKHQTGKSTITYNRNDPSRVLSDCRSTLRCNAVINESLLSAKDMLNLPQYKSTFAAPMVMTAFMEKAFMGNASVSFSRLFVFRMFIACGFNPNKDNLDHILDTDYPIIVQTFNFFSLCWHGRQYEIKDFEEILARVLVMIIREHNCKLNQQDLTSVMNMIIGEDWKTLTRFI